MMGEKLQQGKKFYHRIFDLNQPSKNWLSRNYAILPSLMIFSTSPTIISRRKAYRGDLKENKKMAYFMCFEAGVHFWKVWDIKKKVWVPIVLHYVFILSYISFLFIDSVRWREEIFLRCFYMYYWKKFFQISMKNFFSVFLLK